MYRSSATRIAFAAEKPSRLAATMNWVVSNGVGARSTLDPSRESVTTSGGCVWSRAASAASLSVNRLVVWRAVNAHAPALGVDREHPVGLGLEGLDLALAVDDHGERRRLDAADGEDVLPAAPRGQAEEPGQGRAPDQVDHLPGLAGRGEGEVELGRGAERGLDLLRRDRREPGAGHGDVGPGRADDVVRLLPDQLPLGVEVGRDGDPVRPLRELLDQVHDLLVGRGLDGPGVDQGAGRVLLGAPVRVPGLEVDLDHVAPEAHHGRVAERVGADAAVLPGLDVSLLREDPCDPLGRDVLLGDDQVHVGSLRQGLGEQPSQLPRVGPPAGLLHDLAGQVVDRARLPGVVVGHGLGELGDRLGDGRRDPVVAGRGEAEPVDDGLRLLVAVQDGAEDLDPGPVGDGAGLHEREQGPEAGRVDRRDRPVAVVRARRAGCRRPRWPRARGRRRRPPRRTRPGAGRP